MYGANSSPKLVAFFGVFRRLNRKLLFDCKGKGNGGKSRKSRHTKLLIHWPRKCWVLWHLLLIERQFQLQLQEPIQLCRHTKRKSSDQGIFLHLHFPSFHFHFVCLELAPHLFFQAVWAFRSRKMC